MQIKNLVAQSSLTVGNGDFLLVPAKGFRSFVDVFGINNPDRFYYFIRHKTAVPAEWEAGKGYMSDSQTLVRETVLASSNGGAKVGFSAGDKDVINNLPAELHVQRLVEIVTVSSNIALSQSLHNGKLLEIDTNGVVITAPDTDTDFGAGFFCEFEYAVPGVVATIQATSPNTLNGVDGGQFRLIPALSSGARLRKRNSTELRLRGDVVQI